MEVLSNIVVFDVAAGVCTCHWAGPLVYGLESGGRPGRSVWSEDIVVVIWCVICLVEVLFSCWSNTSTHYLVWSMVTKGVEVLVGIWDDWLWQQSWILWLIRIVILSIFRLDCCCWLWTSEHCRRVELLFLLNLIALIMSIGDELYQFSHMSWVFNALLKQYFTDCHLISLDFMQAKHNV